MPREGDGFLYKNPAGDGEGLKEAVQNAPSPDKTKIAFSTIDLSCKCHIHSKSQCNLIKRAKHPRKSLLAASYK